MSADVYLCQDTWVTYLTKCSLQQAACRPKLKKKNCVFFLLLIFFFFYYWLRGGGGEGRILEYFCLLEYISYLTFKTLLKKGKLIEV